MSPSNPPPAALPALVFASPGTVGSGGSAAPVMRGGPLRSVGARLTLGLLGLLMAVQLIGFGAVRSAIDQNVRASLDSELALTEKLLEQAVARSGDRLAADAAALGMDMALRRALQADERGSGVASLTAAAARIDAPVAAWLDADLRLRVATSRSDSLAPVVHQFAPRVNAGPSESLVMPLDGKPFQFALAPVRTGTAVGWLMLGRPLDPTLLDGVRTLPDLHAALRVRTTPDGAWRTVAATRDGLSHVLDQQAAAAGKTAEAVLAHERQAVRGVLLSPAGTSGEVNVVLLRPIDAAVAPYERLQVFLALLTLGALLLAALAGALGSRQLKKRLRRLADAAERLGRGDLDAPPAGAQRRDEIGELAQVIDRTRLALAGRQQQVLQLAYCDEVTGLPNGAQLRELAGRAIEHGREFGGGVGVVMLELQRLRQLQEVFGPAFGDQLLQRVAERLRRDCVRDGDVVARLAGERFAVLLRDADMELTTGVARRVQKALARPVALQEQTVDVGASVGLACWPQHAHEADDLLKRAALALQTARRCGQGPVAYDVGFDAASAPAASLLAELRQAIDHGELRLYLQPKVSLERGAVIGAEALMRWQHPQRGLVPPSQFVPFAEQSGLVRKLTIWIFERAAEQWRTLHQQGLRLRLSVNLSARDLLDQDLPDKLDLLLDKHAVPAEGFCLEISETALMDDAERAQNMLERLSRRGFRIALDDFGRGYSSLGQLKKLAVDELKIDRSFVSRMERDLEDAKIVRAGIDLAHNLGLVAVAVGAETPETMQQLRDLSCDEAQGEHLAAPMPAEQFGTWCALWNSRHIQVTHSFIADDKAVVLH